MSQITADKSIDCDFDTVGGIEYIRTDLLPHIFDSILIYVTQ